MKKFKSMMAMTAAVLTLSAMAVPMSAFAEDTPTSAAKEFTYSATDQTQDVFVTYGTTKKVQKTDPTTGEPVYETDPETGEKIPVYDIIENTVNAPTYTVTIPADVAFNDAFNDKTNQVKVDDVFLEKGKAVEVDITSTNGYNMILNGTDATTAIAYNVKINNSNDALTGTSKTKVIEVVSGTSNAKGSGIAVLHFSVPIKNVPAAGAYSDKLTFTISVVDATAP